MSFDGASGWEPLFKGELMNEEMKKRMKIYLEAVGKLTKRAG